MYVHRENDENTDLKCRNVNKRGTLKEISLVNRNAWNKKSGSGISLFPITVCYLVFISLSASSEGNDISWERHILITPMR